MANWLASVGYSGRTHASELHRRLTAAPRGAAGIDGATITATSVQNGSAYWVAVPAGAPAPTPAPPDASLAVRDFRTPANGRLW